MAIETVVCLMLGMLMLAVSHCTGVILVFSFVSIMFRCEIEELYRNWRIQRMRDAGIEASWYRNGMN